MEIDNQRLR